MENIYIYIYINCRAIRMRVGTEITRLRDFFKVSSALFHHLCISNNRDFAWRINVGLNGSVLFNLAGCGHYGILCLWRYYYVLL